jgi:hypothetical protein
MQERRLAAARIADEREKLAGRDVEVRPSSATTGSAPA